MRNFQRKTGWGSVVESWPVLALLGVFILFFAWGVAGFLGKMQTTRDNRKMAEAKLLGLEEEKRILSYDTERLKTDEGKEAIIREKFGLAKEGEGEIVIVEDMNPPTLEPEESSGFFSFLRNLFK